MTNLINTLSQKLQNQLSDYGVSVVFVECGELNVRSDYSMDMSFYQAIEDELKQNGNL